MSLAIEWQAMTTTQPHHDTRPAQAARVANYLEQHSASTQKEIDTACDTGCISKVLSDMPRMDYGLGKGWCRVPCPVSCVLVAEARWACAHLH